MRLVALCLVSIAATTCVAACGARTDLDAPPMIDEPTEALVCEAYTACGEPPDACEACMRENIGPCSELTTCEAEGPCEQFIPENQRCRVDAVQTVECMLTCSFDTCMDVYFAMGRGPVMPTGLTFGNYVCAVCHPCAHVCAGTPNFSVVCDLLG